MRNHMLRLNLRTQQLQQDGEGHNYWQEINRLREWPAEETVLLLCDVWDKHWSRGASERVDAMVPRMEQLVGTARARGVQIVHMGSRSPVSLACLTRSWHARMNSLWNWREHTRVVEKVSDSMV